MCCHKTFFKGKSFNIFEIGEEDKTVQKNLQVINEPTCQNKADDKIEAFEKTRSIENNIKLPQKVEVFLVWGGGVETAFGESFQSVENSLLSFVHIKQLLTESGQHELFFSACGYFQALLGFLGFMISWEWLSSWFDFHPLPAD